MSWFHNKRTGMENAVDIVVPVGSKVYAAAPGKVTDASEDKDGYKGIDILHDDDTYTNYGHLSVIEVREGQDIRKGQEIGLSGDTGNLAGLPPHLHFEVFVSDGDSSDSVPFEWEEGLSVEKRKVEMFVPKSVVRQYRLEEKRATG